MTDKEKLNRVIAEIKRLIADFNIKTEKYRGMNEQAHQYYGGKRDALSEILKPIDSMQEEPVSEDLEKEIEQYCIHHGYLDSFKDCGYTFNEQVGDIARHFAEWQKQQIMNGAFVYEKKHDTAMVLASECLRNHGWFGREHDFNDLWQFICGVKELFSGEFKPNDKVRIIAIKEREDGTT